MNEEGSTLTQRAQQFLESEKPRDETLRRFWLIAEELGNLTDKKMKKQEEELVVW